VEALARAAEAFGDELPRIADPGQRRVVGRMQNLVFMIAERAERALDEAEGMVRGLGARCYRHSETDPIGTLKLIHPSFAGGRQTPPV
jgi:hypothetical protein